MSNRFNLLYFLVSSTPPGEIFGPAHQDCNLVAKSSNFLVAASHLFSKFDSLMIIRGLSDSRITNITTVARSSNDFISIRADNIKFFDTFLHLPISLRKCIELLRDSGMHNFKFFAKVFANFSDYWPILIGKQSFCYDYFTEKTMLIVSQELPNRSHFYDSLNHSIISEKEWAQANFIYKLFKCRTLSDYAQLYCLIDSVCLADVFSNHRRLTFMLYNTEIFNYLSAPSLAFRLCLANSEFPLEYISDSNIYLAAKRSLRGGMTGYVGRYAVRKN